MSKKYTKDELKDLEQKASANRKILEDNFDKGLERYEKTGKWPNSAGGELDSFNWSSLTIQANWDKIEKA